MTTANDPWGRVDADGTVYVRTADGERVIGSWAAGSPEEAIVFFRRKFESLETEVTLIEQRIATTEIAPAQAQATVQRLLKSVADANALGDIPGMDVHWGLVYGIVACQWARWAREVLGHRAIATGFLLLRSSTT